MSDTVLTDPALKDDELCMTQPMCIKHWWAVLDSAGCPVCAAA